MITFYNMDLTIHGYIYNNGMYGTYMCCFVLYLKTIGWMVFGGKYVV